MADKMQVIDSDAHIIEDPALMAGIMERFPDKMRLATADEWGAARVVEGRLYPNARGPGAGCPMHDGFNPATSPRTPEGVLADADREGIDQMVFFPSHGLAVPGYLDLSFAAEVARLYNEWLAGYCRAHRERFFGVAVVPIEDVERSIALMRDAKRLGLVATMVPAVLRARNLDHPSLEPFFAAAEELDMPIAVHGAPGIHLPPLGAERFDNYLQVHCVSFPFDMMVATTSLVLGGVLERHPRLRVGLLESGVGWVPYFIERMDEHLEKRGRLAPDCKRKPSEYVERGQLYVSCEPGEAGVRFAVETLGADFILFASDYPHWDGEFPNATRPLRESAELPADVRARIFAGNARVFYGLQG